MFYSELAPFPGHSYTAAREIWIRPANQRPSPDVTVIAVLRVGPPPKRLLFSFSSNEGKGVLPAAARRVCCLVATLGVSKSDSRFSIAARGAGLPHSEPRTTA